MRNITQEEYKLVERKLLDDFPMDTEAQHLNRIRDYMEYRTPKKKKIVEVVEAMETVVISEIVEDTPASND